MRNMQKQSWITKICCEMAVLHLDHHENDIRPVSIDTAWNFCLWDCILTMHGQLTISQLVLAVMLSMSMVTSFAKIEVFSENLREMQYNIEKNTGFSYDERIAGAFCICKYQQL